jgi:hypothetical protein
MNYGAMLLSIPLLLAGCGERKEVVAEETRPLTMRDRNLKLDADNDERFRLPGMGPMAAPPSPVVAGMVPDGWQEAPSSSFRLLNYTFGKEGQAYVSASRGGVLENVNRWLKQFGAPAVDAAGLAAMEKVEFAGYRGVWVAVDGDFAGGMGQSAQSGWSLRGVVGERGGEIVTVKMLGPVAEVAAAEPGLRAYVGGLTPAG